MNENRRKFGERFLKASLGAVIGSGKCTFHKVPSYQMTDYLSRQPIDLKITKEKSIDISLPADEYDRLIDMLGYFSESNFSGQIELYYRDFQTQLIEEKRLRDQNPTLQKVYDRYQTLLALVNEKNKS
jgi:hypothetical protein